MTKLAKLLLEGSNTGTLFITETPNVLLVVKATGNAAYKIAHKEIKYPGTWKDLKSDVEEGSEEVLAYDGNITVLGSGLGTAFITEDGNITIVSSTGNAAYKAAQTAMDYPGTLEDLKLAVEEEGSIEAYEGQISVSQ